jgi:hypothetical protein
MIHAEQKPQAGGQRRLESFVSPAVVETMNDARGGQTRAMPD